MTRGGIQCRPVRSALTEERRRTRGGMQLMNLNLIWLGQRNWLLTCTVALLLCAPLIEPAAALEGVRLEFPTGEIGLSAAADWAPGMEGRVHRMVTRSERALGRLASAVSNGLVTWFWIVLSAALFLVVSAIASATDLRMLNLRGQDPQNLARDLGHGVRMFFRILRDRRTPYLPRAVLVMALLYWLLPVDLVGDGMPVVGMLDDVLVAVLAAKLFIHLCPDTIIAAHAAALRVGA